MNTTRMFQIYEKDLKFLISHIEDANLQTKFRLAVNTGPLASRNALYATKYTLHLNEPEIDTLVDILADVLCSKGIGTDSELTPVGLYIEGLIDTFNSNP